MEKSANIKISVLLPTRNRPEMVKSCLESILKNSGNNWEILVLDQSTNDNTKQIVEKLVSEKIRYYRLKSTGKSKALNKGMGFTRGEILAFTDDDCIVDNNWLQTAEKYLDKNINIAGVLGNVYQYDPENNQGKFCQSTFKINEERIFSDPMSLHFLSIGLGNNMFLRKKVVVAAGGFSEFLGPGSGVSGGDDSEIIFKVLLLGEKLASNPKVAVWHNKWLSKSQYQKIASEYGKSFMVFVGYYWKGKTADMAKQMAKREVENRFFPMLKELLLMPVETAKMFVYCIWEGWGLVSGFIIGLRKRDI